MRQLFVILLIGCVAFAHAETKADEARDFGRGFFGAFGADVDNCLGSTELSQISAKIDDLKNDWDQGSFVQKLFHSAEDIYGFAQLLRQQGQLCHVTQIESLFKTFFAAVKSQGFMNIFPKIMEEHIMDIMEDIQRMSTGMQQKQFQTVGQAFAQLWQALFDSTSGPSASNVFSDESIAAFVRAFDATVFDDATDFAQGFFGGFGADMQKCLDDSDVQTIIDSFNNIKVAAKEEGFKKFVGIAEAIWNFVQDLRGQLKSCQIMTIESEIKAFASTLKAEGAKKVLTAFIEQNLESTLKDVSSIVSSIADHDYKTLGLSSGDLLNDLLSVATPTFSFYTADAGLEDAREFIQGFFTNYGANVDSCVDDADLANMKTAIDEIKSAADAHGLIHKIEGIVEGIESLATLLKAQAHNCDVTSLETTITNFIEAVKDEGIEKVALEAVLHHGLSLIGDGKTLYDGIKSKNYNQMGMATGAILNDIMDENFEFFYMDYNKLTSTQDALQFAQGFFSAFGADVSDCLDSNDLTDLSSDIDSLKAAFKSKKLIEIVTSAISVYSDIKTQADQCDVKQVPELVKTFVTAVKEDGIERVLVNALAVNLKGLIGDAKNLISGFGKKDYDKIGAGFGGLMNHIMGADTPDLMTLEFVSDDVSDAQTVLQGFFNAWGADISQCLDSSDVQKFATLIDSVKAAWKSGSVLQKLEKTVVALYSAWHLVQDEATECKITQIEEAVEKFSAAVKVQGVEKVLTGALEAHIMDLITDGQQIMSGIKTHNFELIGQAVGNVVRSALDVQTSSSFSFISVKADASLDDAKNFAQGFFSSFGADVTKCLDDTDFNNLMTDFNNLKTAFKSHNIGQIVAAGIATFSDVKNQANKCDVKAVPALVKEFVGAIKEDGIERVLANAAVINLLPLIKDVKNLVSGIHAKNFMKIGTGVGGLMNHIMGVDNPSIPKGPEGTSMFIAASKTSDAETFVRGFFESFGADVSQCLDSADMTKIQDQIDDIKKAIKGNPVEALVVVVRDITEIIKEFKSEAQECDVTAVEEVIKSVVSAAKADGVDKYILTVLMEHGLDILSKVKTGVDAFKADDFETAGKAIGGVIEDLKPNETIQFLAGFLA